MSQLVSVISQGLRNGCMPLLEGQPKRGPIFGMSLRRVGQTKTIRSPLLNHSQTIPKSPPENIPNNPQPIPKPSLDHPQNFLFGFVSSRESPRASSKGFLGRALQLP